MFATVPGLMLIVCLSVGATPVQWTGTGSNGHYYELTEGPLTWSAANTFATSRGGYLASITSHFENAFLQLQFFPASQEAFWIGLTDRAAEGLFVWTSGEPLVFTNWSGGEPNNYTGSPNGPDGEDYAVINWSFSLGYDTTRGLWNDTPNTGCGIECVPNPYRAIIEYDTMPVSTPEPATGGLIVLFWGAAGAASLVRRRIRAPFCAELPTGHKER